MSALRLLAVGMFACALTVTARADDKKEKSDNARLLLGKWEVTRADKELPVGSTMEFSKDGKMKITAKDGERKEESLNALYVVKGDQIHFTLQLSDKEEKKDPLTIKKLSEKELVLQAEKGVSFEFKRVK